jgi:hypothetical protein
MVATMELRMINKQGLKFGTAIKPLDSNTSGSSIISAIRLNAPAQK